MYACMSMVVFPRTNAYLYLCLYQYVPYLREDRRSYDAISGGGEGRFRAVGGGAARDRRYC